MNRVLAFAAFALFANAANAQGPTLTYSQMSCDEYRVHLAAAQTGSSKSMSFEAAAYRSALVDAFAWSYGESSVEREFERALDRCRTTLLDAARSVAEAILDEVENELCREIEYAQ